MSRKTRAHLTLIAFTMLATNTLAQSYMPPDRSDLRHDLLALVDAGKISMPAQSWPISSADLDVALASVDRSMLNNSEALNWQRLADTNPTQHDWTFSSSVYVGNDVLRIRRFEDTPRADAGVEFVAAFHTSRFSLNIQTNALLNPLDDDNFNLDGSYAAGSLGNWTMSAGWQERWWGPGWNSSLILSTNARPSPGIALQRKTSRPFESRWLSWIGPWTLTTFMNVLDDERVIDDALLWGARVGFVPVDGLEIGLSRTAQWCGDGRSCSISTFSDVLLGNDNRGVNVTAEDEPGNQLAGVDLRWRLPADLPYALYMQWIGEDTRQGGPEIGSWLRQAGVEHWGDWRDSSYRVHFEWADTTCREGGAGFSTVKPNCSYRHPVYASGYNYEGRSLGHSAAGDSRVLSLGATLVQSADQIWTINIRHMQINREGSPDPRHAISAIRLDVTDFGFLHGRSTSRGRVEIGLNVEDLSAPFDETRFIGFLRWSTL